MNDINKTLIVTFAVLLTGCGLTVPEFDSSNTSDSNTAEYEVVLDENYTGYSDDDELTSAEIDNGAGNFAQCETATECSLLWDTAIEWQSNHLNPELSNLFKNHLIKKDCLTL